MLPPQFLSLFDQDEHRSAKGYQVDFVDNHRGDRQADRAGELPTNQRNWNLEAAPVVKMLEQVL